MADNVVFPADSVDDYWHTAVKVLTGYTMPARETLFGRLLGNDSIPLMRVEFSDYKGAGPDAIVDAVDQLEWRTQNSGWRVENTDFVVPFYSGTKGPIGDAGVKTKVKMKKARVTLLGTTSLDVPAGGVVMGTEFHSGNKRDFQGQSKDTVWSNKALSQYSYGGGEALNHLLINGDTRGFSWNDLPVTDADVVDLRSFDMNAEAFDRVAQFFRQQARELKDWEFDLGKEDASWKGQAAGVFRDLIHSLGRNYAAYSEQFPASGNVGSVHGNDLRAFRREVQNAAQRLWNSWNIWQLYTGNPLRWLHDVLLEVTDEVWYNNLTKVRYQANYGRTPTVSGSHYVKTPGFYGGARAFGPLEQKETWKKIGEEAIRRWQKSVKETLSTAGRQALIDIENAFNDARFPQKILTETVDLTQKYNTDLATREKTDAKKEREQTEKRAEAKQAEAERKQEAKEQEQERKQEAKEKEQEAKQEQKEREAETKQAQAEQKQEAKEKEQEAKQEQKEREAEAKQAQAEQKQEAKEKEQEAKHEQKEREAEAKQAQAEQKQEAKEKEQEAKQEQRQKEADAKQEEQETKQEQRQAQADQQQAMLNQQTAQERAQQKKEQEQKEREAEAKQAQAEQKQEAKQAEQEQKQEAKQAEQEAKQEQRQKEADAKEKEQEAKQEQKEREAEAKQAQAEQKQEAKEKEQEQRQIRTETEYQARQEEQQQAAERRQEQLQAEQEVRQQEAERRVDEQQREAEERYGRQAGGFGLPVDSVSGPDSATTTLNPDGSVNLDYPDGTSRSVDLDSGEVVTTHPNGSTSTQMLEPGESITNSDGSTTTLGLDRRLTTSFPDGSTSVFDPDLGSITTHRPDGTTISTPIDPGQTLPTASGGIQGSEGNSNGSSLYSPSYGEPGYEEELYDDLLDSPNASEHGMGAGSGAGGMPMLPMGTRINGSSSGGPGSENERFRTMADDGQPVTMRRSNGRAASQDESVTTASRNNVATMGGAPFAPPMGGAGGPGQQQTESGDRQRASWADVDEDVWGTDEDAAPATAIGR